MVKANLSRFEFLRPANVLCKNSFQLLKDGKLPGIVHPDFLSSAYCHEVLSEIYSFGFSPYESAEDDISRIGLPLVDKPRLDDYLKNAEIIEKNGLFPKIGKRLRETLVGFLALGTGRKVIVFNHHGNSFSCGVFRNFNTKIGAGIHVDKINRDCPELSGLAVDFQGSLVLHLKTPENGEGGSTRIYEKYPQAEDENDPLKIESGWKYSSSIIKDTNSVLIPANCGSLVILPTERYHSVDSAEKSPADRRISFSFFIFTLSGDDTIYCYS